MSLDRGLVKCGDLFLLRDDPKDPEGEKTLEEGITWGEWAQGRSPEFYHVGLFRDIQMIAQQNPPYPKLHSIATLDDKFDRGLVCHMRAIRATPSGRTMVGEWIDAPLGPHYPYGFGLIGLYSVDGLLDRAGLTKMGEWLKSKDFGLDYQHAPVCSTWVWMALSYGLGYDFAEKHGIGRGRIIPADFYSMKDEFQVIQDGRKS